MSQENVQHENRLEAQNLKEHPFGQAIVDLYMRRRLLCLVAGIGMLLSTGIMLIEPNLYTSSARIMPPDAQMLSTPSVLSLLTATGPSALGGVGSSLIGGRTPGQTVIGILQSNTVQDDIIQQFDLKRIYKSKTQSKARLKLASRPTIIEDKRSGIVSVDVSDPDRVLACSMAKAYVDELNKLLNASNSSSARRERVFLEERLKSLHAELEQTSQQLSQFSSHNGTLDPQTQGQSILLSASRLQGELVAAKGELSGLLAQYTDDNFRVKAAQAQIAELQKQLNKIDGTSDSSAGEEINGMAASPSLRKLPALGVIYSDLYHRMMTQEGVLELLTKQYEIAKVQEAKEIPTAKVLDEPQVAEEKSSPHRLQVIAMSTLMSFFLGCFWVVLEFQWKRQGEDSLLKQVAQSISAARDRQKLSDAR